MKIIHVLAGLDTETLVKFKSSPKLTQINLANNKVKQSRHVHIVERCNTRCILVCQLQMTAI